MRKLANVNVPFSFDEVAQYFDEMATRHIPNYWILHDFLSNTIFPNDGVELNVVDLGVSTGNMLAAIHGNLTIPEANFVGCDVSSEMVKYARMKCGFASIMEMGAQEYLDLCPVESLDVVMLNYVLQFIPFHERAP